MERVPFYTTERRNVLDIGAATGRNAIFLASRGYNVIAVDSSKQAVDELNEYAKKENLPLSALVSDINYAGVDYSKNDIVLFLFIMHYLSREKGQQLLLKYFRKIIFLYSC